MESCMTHTLWCVSGWYCMWCKLMKKWEGAQQGNVLHVCREHVKPDESCLNLSEGVSEPMGGGETIGGRATLADSILKVITELLPLTEGYLRECAKPLCIFIRSNLSVWNPTSPKLDFVTAVSVLSSLSGTGQSKDEYLSITVPPPHIHYPHLKGASSYWFPPPAKSLVNSCLVGQPHYSFWTLNRYQ